MGAVLYIIGAIAFCLGVMVVLLGPALVGAVYLLIATTAFAGGAVVYAIQGIGRK